MKSPLWSKVLGVLLGIFIGAGVTYAAVFDYRADVPSGITVSADVEVVPGFEVTPDSLDFGFVAPGYSSSEVSLSVKNVGDKGAKHRVEVQGRPSGMKMYVFTTPDGAWREVPHEYWYVNNPGSTRAYKFYISCSGTVAEGSHNFTIVIREP